MRYSYFLVLLLVTVAATVQGLANDVNSLQTSNIKSSPNQAIVDGDSLRRNLKGSSTTETENGAEDEERSKLSSLFSKMASGFKGNTKYAKALETSPEFINAVKKNPAFSMTLKDNQDLVKIFAKNPTLMKQFEDPVTTKALGDALKNPTLLKSFQKDKDIKKIITAFPTVPSGLTNTQIEKIGQAVAKSNTVSRGISDEGQQLTAWGAAIVGTIIIVIIGIHIANKK